MRLLSVVAALSVPTGGSDHEDVSDARHTHRGGLARCHQADAGGPGGRPTPLASTLPRSGEGPHPDAPLACRGLALFSPCACSEAPAAAHACSHKTSIGGTGCCGASPMVSTPVTVLRADCPEPEQRPCWSGPADPPAHVRPCAAYHCCSRPEAPLVLGRANGVGGGDGAWAA